MNRLTLTLFGWLTLSACGESFESISRLEGLRLIAVAADKPTANAGDEVRLTSLYYEPQGRALEWGYAFCDSQTSSAALDCLRSIDLSTLTVQVDQPEYVLTMPDLPENPERATALGIAIIVCPGKIVEGDTQGIPLACEVDGKPLAIDDFELSVKRVFYEQNSKNQNPVIEQISWDGQAWPEEEVKTIAACPKNTDDVTKCDAAFRHTLKVEAPNATERYLDPNGGSASEQAAVQFYADGGTLEWSARTPDSAQTRFIARAEDAGKTLSLHVVVRDSRGGVTWQTRTVRVQ